MKNKIIDIISNSGTWQTDNEGREGTWIDKQDINSIAEEIVKNCSIPDVVESCRCSRCGDKHYDCLNGKMCYVCDNVTQGN